MEAPFFVNAYSKRTSGGFGIAPFPLHKSDAAGKGHSPLDPAILRFFLWPIVFAFSQADPSKPVSEHSKCEDSRNDRCSRFYSLKENRAMSLTAVGRLVFCRSNSLQRKDQRESSESIPGVQGSSYVCKGLPLLCAKGCTREGKKPFSPPRLHFSTY